jgi:hypothetical protein
VKRLFGFLAPVPGPEAKICPHDSTKQLCGYRLSG